jgi:nitroimidazol reductase NimA-like FMN-containing flavoprotein (pyridoxamine 5'-phosphate oxidase superfamily)
MASSGVGLMSESEVIDFIKNASVGILSLVDGDKPYAVPLEHYFDGKTLHFSILPTEGRKVRCIRNNANACFVIYESRHERPKMTTPCRSVIIEGKVSVHGASLRMDIKEIGNWKCPPSRFAACEVG